MLCKAFRAFICYLAPFYANICSRFTKEEGSNPQPKGEKSNSWAQGRRRRGVGGPDPRTFENRVGIPPKFENEVAKIRCFLDF